MFLAIDIGNTNTVIGVYQREKLVSSWRLVSSHTRTMDEYWIVTKLFCEDANIDIQSIRGIIIGSVVPVLTRNYLEMGRKYFGLEAIIVNQELDLGFELEVDQPESVGADRICNVAAARQLYAKPAVVIDLGTATTFDVIDEKGDYIGGAIAPGIYTAGYELSRKAAKLSNIELVKPRNYIGKNTTEHLQMGIFIGHIAMIEGLVKRMIKEYNRDQKFFIIATGGLSGEITNNCSLINKSDKNLTLEGLKILYNRNTNDTVA